jgi:2-polyprenyl-3-methyl-5-hydroxy-6-metoxy-1,4-benzoquinol methylase
MSNPSLTRYQLKNDPCSSHSIIRNWLVNYPPGQKVLDVGVATGVIGRISEDTGHLLFGIEPDAEWAKLAEPYYQQIEISTIEETSEDKISNFDIVICGDVLEHLVDPDAELARLVRLQGAGTVFIISVPNIANIWVRLQLLFGKFDYMDRGILDRSHLKFFTRKTFYEMISSTGLRIVDREVTPIPFYLAFPRLEKLLLGKFLYWLSNWFTHTFPTLFGYQFIVKAEKLPDQGGDYDRKSKNCYRPAGL